MSRRVRLDGGFLSDIQYDSDCVPRDADGIIMKSGAVFENEARRKRMDIEFRSPVASPGVVQPDDQILASEVARLNGELARLRLRNAELEAANRGFGVCSPGE